MLNDLFPDLPPYVLAAAVLHLAFVLALIIPVWRIFSRADMGGAWALILLVPAIGLLAIPVMLAAVILRRAGWPLFWFVATILPLLNVVFLWVFAYARWPGAERAAPARAAAETGRDYDRPRIGALEGAAAEPAPAAAEAVPESGAAAAPSEEEYQLERASAVKKRRTQPASHEDTLTPAQQQAEAEPATKPHSRRGKKARVWVMSGANARSADIRLRVTEEDLAESTEGLLVGRSSRADFILTDDSVSRNHARISLRNGKLCVEDLDSMNGTWVNGRKLEPGTPEGVSDAAEIEFGQMKLVVQEA